MAPKHPFRKVAPYYWLQIKKYKWSFFIMFGSYGIATLIMQLVPLYFREIIDVITNANVPATIAGKLMSLMLMITILTLTYNALHRIGDYFIVRMHGFVTRELTDYTFSKIQAHSYRFFSESFAGSIVAKARRFIQGYDAIQDQFLFSFWLTGIQLISVLIILFSVAPIIGVILLLWCFIYIIITLIFVKMRTKYDLIEATADSSVTSQLSDVLANILNIKIFSARKREETSFAETATLQMKARVVAWQFDNMQNLVQGLFMATLHLGGMYIAIHLWLNGSITSGTIVLIETYFISIFGSIWNLGRSISYFGKSVSYAVEMIEIFEKTPDIQDPLQPEKVRIEKGSISFENVTFHYGEGSNTIFKDFTFSIASGQRVGIVGHSGAGKSTITKMLLRFADIASGSITIDGQDIRAITQDDLRNHITYVPQDPLLFHRTLRENISYAKPDATIEEIIDAAKHAHAHEFISHFPDQYETLVGERGVKLSGGERQRIAIARAFLKKAPILVLDEATSSLDSLSEKYIQESFNELMQGKTTIVIAHRLSTIQRMDRIVVIENGEIAEDGTHAKLLEKKGTYHSLWSHQAGGFIKE